MDSTNSYRAFNTPAAIKKSRLLPFISSAKSVWSACSNCTFINLTAHNYCTNCGHPLMPNKDRVTLYNYRLQQRKQLLVHSEKRVLYARNTLYIMAALCLAGVTFFFTDSTSKQSVLSGFILLIVAALFVGLGRWSLKNPFTALLISFLILLTFIAINTWAEFMSLFTTALGLYSLLIQVVCFIILLRGLQAAFRADIMEEEFKL